MYSEFNELQTEIEMMADKPDEAYATRAQFEDQYYSLLAMARSLSSKARKSADSQGFVTGSEPLMPALVKVANSKGEKYNACILLDNGSTANFITESLCSKLRLSRDVANFTVTEEL